MNVVDYLIITVLFLSGLSGFKRGLLDAVGRIVSLVSGLLVALCFCDDLTLILQHRFAFTSILAVRLQGTPLSFNELDNPLLQLMVADLPGAQDARLWVAQTIAVIISFLVILAVVITVINVLWQPLTGVFQHGIIGVFNRVGGLVLNIAKNALIIAVIFLTVFPLLQSLAVINLPIIIDICNYLQDSRILTWLYDSIPRIGVFPGQSV
jgi:uncharacterized membrane protein required for colicin V production